MPRKSPMSYLKCPGCNKYTETKVVNVRKAVKNNGLRRRRECLDCGARYSTVELIVPEGKRSGYSNHKPLYFEEDYHRDENSDIGGSSRYKHRMRRERHPRTNPG